MKSVLRFLIVIAVILPASAASILWTNTAGGVWSDAANWSPNQVPTATDDVLITQGGTYSVVLNGPTTVASIVLGADNGTQTLVMAATTLTAGTLTVRQNGIFDRDGVFQDRTITTATGITVLGRFRLQPPSTTVSGSLTVVEGAQLEILGDLMLSQSALTNGGTTTLGNRAKIRLMSDSSIRNLATGTLIFSGDDSGNQNSGIQYWADAGNLNQFLASEGRIRSDNEVFIDVPCSIGGELEVRSGTLDLRRHPSYPVAGQNVSAAVTVAAGAVLSLRGWGFEFVSPASINCLGTFRAGANGTVNLRTGVTFVAANLEAVMGGNLNFETGSPIAIDDGLLENSGSITGSDAITIGGDFISRGGGAFRGSGPVSIDPSAFVSLQGSTLEFARPFLINNGQMFWVGSRFYLGNQTVFTNRGSLTITNSANEVSPTMIDSFNAFEDEAIYNEGSITVADANATDVRVPIFNSGTVRLERNRLWFVLAGGYSQTAGRTELAGGNMEFGSPRFSLLGGELIGSGSILGIGTLTNVGGIVSPGISPGRINLTGRYIQQSGATLNIELGGTEPGTGFDQIVADISASLAGTLNLTIANGFAPVPGTRFLIVSSPLRSGQFGTVNLPPGLDLRVNYRNDGAEVEFVSVSLLISPNTVSLVPGETQTFSAATGSPPYNFSLVQNNSGGTIDAASGVYLAGPNPGTDTVRVVDALNASAQATVNILAPLQVSPTTVEHLPGQTETFIASGGSPPYTFSVRQNNSGGSIDASSGAYTAGLTRGVTDTVRVTDAAGRFVEATVTIPTQEIFTVTTTADSGLGSFRQAILDANASTLPMRRIHFNIPGTPPFRIAPQTPLPFVEKTTQITGATQAGSNGPIIELDGRALSGDEADGLRILSSGSVVRGLAIFGFEGKGIALGGQGNHAVQGCYLGTDSTGTAAFFGADNRPLQNTGVDVAFSSNNLIGGVTANARNVIAGNHVGVSLGLQSSSNVVLGNYIGTDASGTRSPGNNSAQRQFIGVDIFESQGNRVGDVPPEGRNVIAFHVGNGVAVAQSSERNQIRRNSIFNNDLLGIELGNAGSGLTPNDPGDADTGANGLQNFPILSAILNPGITPRIQGTLNSTPSSTFIVDFYANSICDPLGNGEGERFLGATTVTTDASGNATFEFAPTLPAPGLGGTDVVTATATDALGNTSEFSPCLPAMPAALSSISGRVLHAGSPLSGVTVTLTGSVQATTTSGASGAFSFNDLPVGGVYSVRPSRSGFVFRPATAEFNGLATPGSVEFNGEAVVRIFGRVTDLGGALVNGAEVLLSGSISRTAKTRDGAFSFEALPVGGNYTIFVSMKGQDFGPPKSLIKLSADQQVDFTAANPPGVIRGTVTQPDGTPVAGVAIGVISTFSIGTPVQRSTTTGADGTYEFRDLPLERDYRVSGGGNFIFRPPSHTVSVASAGATANFTVEPARRISGRITLAHGTADGMELLFITGNDFVAARVPVDAQGRFASPLLRDDRTYTVRPQKTGYTFAPASAEIALSDADISAVNFTGDTTFRSILGNVANTFDQGVPDATVHAIRQNDPGFFRAVTTSAQGDFNLTELPQAPDYVLFAHKQNFLISPRTRDDQFISLGNNDVFRVGFYAVGGYMIRGRVTNPSGAGAGGIRMAFHTEQIIIEILTDADGRYEYGPFEEGTDLLVEPSSPGVYDPPNRTITALASDHTVDFVRSTRLPIRGTIRTATGFGIPGVVFEVTGGTAQQTASDVNGRYEVVLAGEAPRYTLTPSRPGFSFQPPSASFDAGVSANSFRAAAQAPAFVADFVATPTLSLSGRIAFALQVTDRSEELMIMNADSGALVPVVQASLPGHSNSPGETDGSDSDCPEEFDFFCGVEGVAAGFAGALPSDSRVNENNLQQSPPFSSKTLAISPDGRRVVFASLSGGGTLRPFDSELDELTGILRTVEIGVPGSVAQVGDDGSALQIGISTRGKPSWSHNGARVAYSAADGIFVISPDAGAGTRVTGTDARDLDPALSPDGTRLAFARREANGTYNLYMIDVNGGGFLQLTFNAGNDRYPAWSPDGEKIAFASDRDGDYDIFLLENQQFDEFRQTSNSDVDDLHPTWSPDGTLLAFQRTGPSAIAGDPGPSFIWVKRVNVPAASLEIPLMVGRRPSWSATPTVQTPASSQPLTIGSGAVSITFGAVTGSGGETTIIPASPADPSDLPAGYFAIDGSLLTYEISTTANFPPPATVCFTLSDIPDNRESDFNALRILHAENGTLQDRTILSGPLAPNFALRQICASVNSFSPFVIARTADLSKPMILGKALDQGGNPLPGVTVRLSGSATRTTVTDADGGYVFPELESGGDYLVVPLDVNLAFAPDFSAIDNLTNTVQVFFLGHPKPAPELSVAMDKITPGRVNLSWPAQSPNLVLESTTSLTMPIWMPVPETQRLIDASIVVHFNTAGTRFFRLRRQ